MFQTMDFHVFAHTYLKFTSLSLDVHSEIFYKKPLRLLPEMSAVGLSAN